MTINGQNYCSRCIQPYEEGGVCPHCGFDAKNEKQPSYMLEERTVLEQRYLIGAAIGAGGFGITYAAWDRTLGIPVAIKEYFPRELATRDIDEDDEIMLLPGEENSLFFQMGLDRFEREAHVLAMLQAVPGIVTVFNWFRANGTAYLVMEYLRGETLGDYCRRTKPDYRTLLQMLRQPIDALITCHKQGVLHRDISTSNLLVLQDGSVKLIDFGAAAQQARRAVGQDHSVLLNRKFAPLEQYDENGNQGPWTDVYALCATIYALVAGEPAPEAPLRAGVGNLPALKIPYDQNKTLRHGMAVQPENRIQGMEELRSRLYHLPLPEEISRHKRFVRRFTSIALAAMLLAMIVAFNFVTGLPLGYGLLFSLHADGWHITGAMDVPADLALPESRLGIPVTRVTEEAFVGKENLKKLLIPGNVTSIGNRAFFGCPELEMVTLEEGVVSAGAGSFASCPELHSFYVPYSLREIQPDVLQGASDLLCVWGERDMNAYEMLSANSNLPFFVRSEYETEPNKTGLTLLLYTDGLADARTDPWTLVFPSYIDGLKVTRFAESTWAYGYVEECVFHIPPTVDTVIFPEYLERMEPLDYEFRLGDRQLVFGHHLKEIAPNAFYYPGANYVEHMELPEGLVRIEDYAFSESRIGSITLPSTLEFIEDYAFEASNLLTITIPDSVHEIGEFAFADCFGLEYARLPSGITKIRYGTFMNAGIQTVYIPEGIVSVEDDAFSYSGIEYLYLPDSMKEIGNAFQNTLSLQYIRIPAEASIAQNAFHGANPDMIIAGYPGSAAQRYAEEYGYRFEDVTRWNVFPDTDDAGCISILGEAGEELVCASFDCENNALVTKFDGHIYGYDEALYQYGYCPSVLSSLELPLFAEEISLTTAIDGGFPALADIVLPDTVQSISDTSFSDSGLQSVSVPPLVSSLSSVFNYCSSLTDIHFDSYSTLSEVWNSFGNCQALTEVALPYSLHIMAYSFSECTALQSIRINEGCVEITECFSGCDRLQELAIPATAEVFDCSLDGCASLKDLWFFGQDTAINTMRDPERYRPQGTVYHEQMQTYCSPAYANITIHGYPGSTAESYAQCYGLSFEPIE